MNFRITLSYVGNRTDLSNEQKLLAKAQNFLTTDPWETLSSLNDSFKI